MYRATALVLPPDRVRAFAAIAVGMHLTPGPGGSTASGSVLTIEKFQCASDVFMGQWTKAMVMALWPSSQLVKHRDPSIDGTRHHLPLVVNDGCWAFHDGDWQQLVVGQCYQMDPTKPHGAVNWGATVRYHLVIDLA